jgi:dCMP deaminase
MSSDIKKYLKMAYKTAKSSPDPSTQNGAVLVTPSNKILAACNDFPNGVVRKNSRLRRPLKYDYIEHAERNVLYEAARIGLATKGSVLYVPWFACADCARAIIQSGISRIIGHEKMCAKTPEHWKKSIDKAMIMFNEAGIITEWFSENLDISYQILFNGKWFSPK